jgi:hypothetical protein
MLLRMLVTELKQQPQRLEAIWQSFLPIGPAAT